LSVSSDHPSAFMPAESAKKEPPIELVAQAVAPSAEPLRDVRGWQGLADEDLRQVLASREAQARILAVVKRRVGKGAPDHLVDDIVQNANVTAITATSRPRTRATALGWLATLAARTVADHFRREAVHRKWLEPDAELDELAGEPEQAPEDNWLLGRWLAQVVVESARDQETYELLVYKANTGKTLEEVAADHAMTTGALKSRIFALKNKYQPRWQRRQRMMFLLLLLGALGLVLLIVWLLRPPPHQDIQPAHDFVIPAEKPTVVPTDDPFNRALPHEEPAKPPVPNKPVQDKPPM
jgi:DNA-directed RNA polymerase specialized sigma24 family protein